MMLHKPPTPTSPSPSPSPPPDASRSAHNGEGYGDSSGAGGRGGLQGTLANTPAARSEAARLALEMRTRDVVQAFYDIAQCAAELQPGEESLMGLRINETVQMLGELRDTEGLDQLIPWDIVTNVDSGRNPDQFTRQFVGRLASDNQQMKGQADGFMAYRTRLSSALSAAFPEMASPIADLDAELDLDVPGEASEEQVLSAPSQQQSQQQQPLAHPVSSAVSLER